MAQVRVKSKQHDFTWGLVIAAVFLVATFKITGHVTWWSVVIAVVGSVVLDWLFRSSPKKGVYIE